MRSIRGWEVCWEGAVDTCRTRINGHMVSRRITRSFHECLYGWFHKQTLGKHIVVEQIRFSPIDNRCELQQSKFPEPTQITHPQTVNPTIGCQYAMQLITLFILTMCHNVDSIAQPTGPEPMGMGPLMQITVSALHEAMMLTLMANI